MLKCPFCQTMHVDNTLFCEECGTYLLDDGGRDTFELEDEQKGATEETPQAPEQDSGAGVARAEGATQQKPPVIRLKIASTPRELEMTLDRIVYLGRLDPVASVYPEVDLTNDKGLEFGVSRQHVRLVRREEGVFVEDLGSINGTFINGHQLAPYQMELLLDGDVIRLGRLDVAVSFL